MHLTLFKVCNVTALIAAFHVRTQTAHLLFAINITKIKSASRRSLILRNLLYTDKNNEIMLANICFEF